MESGQADATGRYSRSYSLIYSLGECEVSKTSKRQFFFFVILWADLKNLLPHFGNRANSLNSYVYFFPPKQ